MIDLTDDVRAMLKAKRLENGWNQREMGALVGITGGAISGIETGSTQQIHKTVLAKYFRVFGETKSTPRSQPVNANRVESIVEAALPLSDSDQQMVLDFAKRLANRP